MWWPALVVAYYVDSRVTSAEPIIAGRKKVLVVSFYQLLGGRIVGWWLWVEVDA